MTKQETVKQANDRLAAELGKRLARYRGELVEQAGAYSTDGGRTWQWESNHSFCPLDALDEHGIEYDPEAQAEARDKEVQAFLAEYRARQPKEPSAEERFEALAAHGPGVRLVNVITGRSFVTG